MSIIKKIKNRQLTEEQAEQSMQAVTEIISGVGAEKIITKGENSVVFRTPQEIALASQLATMNNNQISANRVGFGMAKLNRSDSGYCCPSGFQDPTRPDVFKDAFGNPI